MEPNLKELCGCLQDELLVTWDGVGFSSDWQSKIIDNEVIRASTDDKQCLVDMIFGLFPSNCRLQSSFILFKVLQLLWYVDHILW
jgi:hypothetical protein